MRLLAHPCYGDKCWFVFPDFDAKVTCSAWLEAQDLLAANLDAEHITHTKSGHFIQGDNPQLVVGTVREVVADTSHELSRR
jgi:hypothetical protein